MYLWTQPLVRVRFLSYRTGIGLTASIGYTLSNLQNSSNGITASLSLAGPACNAFGQDIQNLTLQVTYETSSRLHVNIFDTANQQFTIPDSVIAPPESDPDASADSSDLAFNFEENPFAFWITRKSEPDAAPLFDTRQSSLPSTPIAAQNPDDPSTAINSTALVFENLYLQVRKFLRLVT
jgi:alpha-glucosidase